VAATAPRTVPCACGCGDTFVYTPPGTGRPRRYINTTHQRWAEYAKRKAVA